MTEFNDELFLKTGLSDGIDGAKRKYKVSKSKKCQRSLDDELKKYMQAADDAR